QKELLVGKPNFNMFIRYQYIQMIDKKWLDQLEYLDGLREAVHLRSYGSKNPLTEYKNDGFDQFDVMLESIRKAVESRIFKVKIQLQQGGSEVRRPPQQRMQMNAQHEEAQSAIAPQQQAQQAFNARQAQQGAANTGMKSGRQGQSVTVMRTLPKVGRNDPCPCGSGKKYKLCHGRNS
ncbi:MAG: SEC-C domain-containing protein, partial [Treponema sp.]|nr:SEC-C domain-containing protein [Treponema sp.]